MKEGKLTTTTTVDADVSLFTMKFDFSVNLYRVEDSALSDMSLHPFLLSLTIILLHIGALSSSPIPADDHVDGKDPAPAAAAVRLLLVPLHSHSDHDGIRIPAVVFVDDDQVMDSCKSLR